MEERHSIVLAEQAGNDLVSQIKAVRVIVRAYRTFAQMKAEKLKTLRTHRKSFLVTPEMVLADTEDEEEEAGSATEPGMNQPDSLPTSNSPTITVLVNIPPKLSTQARLIFTNPPLFFVCCVPLFRPWPIF